MERRFGPTVGQLARRVEAGRCFAEMSELPHGRGPLMDLIWWESVTVDSPLSADDVRLVETVSDALTLCIYRVQAGLFTAADDAGRKSLAARLATTPITGPSHGCFRT